MTIPRGLSRDLRALGERDAERGQQAEKKRQRRQAAQSFVAWAQQDLLQQPVIQAMQDVLPKMGRKYVDLGEQLWLTGDGLRVAPTCHGMSNGHHRLRVRHFEHIDDAQRGIARVQETVAYYARDGVFDQAQSLGHSAAIERLGNSGRAALSVLIAPIVLPLLGIGYGLHRAYKYAR